MVELQSSPYDTEYIPMVSAVTIDDELLSSPEPTIATAHSIPESPTPQPPLPAAPSQKEDTRIRNGAAAGGAILGLLFGGPFFSIVLGVGAAHYSKLEGASGDCARALGEIALVTKDKFTKVNEDHHLVDKGKEAAANLHEQLHAADREHHIREKAGSVIRQCWAFTLEFVEKHKLIEQGSEKFKIVVDKLTNIILEHHNSSLQNSAQQQEERSTRSRHGHRE